MDLPERLDERDALEHERDAQHQVAIRKSVAGSGCRSSLMPWLMETTAPAVNSPKAANIDQTYASRP